MKWFDVINKFKCQKVAKEYLNLEVLQCPTSQGKVPQGVDQFEKYERPLKRR